MPQFDVLQTISYPSSTLRRQGSFTTHERIAYESPFPAFAISYEKAHNEPLVIPSANSESFFLLDENGGKYRMLGIARPVGTCLMLLFLKMLC